MRLTRQLLLLPFSLQLLALIWGWGNLQASEVLKPEINYTGNQTVSLSISLDEMENDYAGIQFTITYPKDALKVRKLIFKNDSSSGGQEVFAIEDLTQDSFSYSDNDKINFLWYDTENPLTKQQKGELLFRVDFEVIKFNGEEAVFKLFDEQGIDSIMVNTGFSVEMLMEYDVSFGLPLHELRNQFVNSGSTEFVEYGSSYVDQGLYYIDSEDKAVSVLSDANVNTRIIGKVDAEYTAVTEEGIKISGSRAIIVQDTVAPKITLSEHVNLNYYIGGDEIELNAQAYDDFDGFLAVDRKGYVDWGVPGTYELQYEAVDSNGNIATVQQVVHVYKKPNVEMFFTSLKYTDTPEHIHTALILKGSEYTINGFQGTISYDPEQLTFIGKSQGDDLQNTTGILLTDEMEHHKVEDGTIIFLADMERQIQISSDDEYLVLPLTFKVAGENMSSTKIDLNGSRIDLILSGNSILPASMLETSSIISFNDESARPSLSGVYPDKEMHSLGETYEHTLPVFVDYKGNTLDVSISSNFNSDLIGINEITYTATDALGNTNSLIKSVEVVDRDSPSIVLVGDQTVSLPVHSEYNELGVISTDNQNVETININGSIDNNKVGEYSITYQAIDGSGNLSEILTRTVNVVDNEKPAIQLVGQNPITIAVGSDFTDPSVKITDNYDAEPVLIVEHNLDVLKLGNYIFDYTAVDSNNNSTSITRQVNVVDRTPPVISLKGNRKILLTVGEEFEDPGVTYDDNHDPDPQLYTSSDLDLSIVGHYYIQYYAVDHSGNKSTVITRYLFVKNNVGFVFSLLGQDKYTIEAGSDFVDPGVFCAENGQELQVKSENNIQKYVPGEYTIQYHTIDENNQLHLLERQVSVVDTTPPSITVNGIIKKEISVYSTYELPDINIEDLVDNNPLLVVNNNINTTKKGVYTVTIQGEDFSGNKTEIISYKIEVIDFDAPLLTLIGDEQSLFQVGGSYTDPGFNVVDNYDPNPNVTIEGAVQGNVLGKYVVKYIARDDSGNESSRTRIVEVVDSIKPLINKFQNNEITVEYGNESWGDLVVAHDNNDEEVELGFKIETNVLDLGLHPITVIATDSSGNTSEPYQFTLRVVDSIPPALELIGDTSVYLEVNAEYIESGVKVSDLYDQAPKLEITSHVKTNLVGIYDVIYSAWDNSNNYSETIRKVVVKDSTPPLITINGSEFVYLFVGEQYADEGFVVLDNYTTDVTTSVSNNIDIQTPGEYSITYKAMDGAGNESVATRGVKVIPQNLGFVLEAGNFDHVPEKFEVSVNLSGGTKDVLGFQGTISYDPKVCSLVTLGDSVFVQSSRLDEQTGIPLVRPSNFNLDKPGKIIFLWFSDDLSPVVLKDENFFSLLFKINDQAISDTVISVESSELELIAIDSDEKQNRVPDQSTRIHFNDNQYSPLIKIDNEYSSNLELGKPIVEPMISARDFRGNALEVVQNNAIDLKNPGNYNIAYSANDIFGNTSIIDLGFIVTDTTAPSVTINGNSVEYIEIGTLYTDAGVTVFDQVDDDPLIKIDDQVNTNTAGIYRVFYTAEDFSGNQSIQSREVHVEDNTKPNIYFSNASTLIVQVGELLELDSYFINDHSAITSKGVDLNNFNNKYLGDYSITYYAEDVYGNKREIDRLVSVVDIAPPTISLKGDQTVILFQGNAFTDPGVLAYDNYEFGEINVTVLGLDDLDEDVPGTYILNYFAVDSSSNQSAILQRKIEVFPNETVPDPDSSDFIKLFGENPMYVELGSDYLEPGGEFSFSEISSTDLNIIGSPDTSVLGDYLIKYYPNHAPAQHALIAVRTVVVIDTTPPVINIRGPAVYAIEVGQPYLEYGADIVDKDSNAKISISGNINTNSPGEYILTYDCTDSSGNTAPLITRTIIVKDSRPPVVNLNGSSTVYLGMGNSFSDSEVTAFDNVDGNVPVQKTGTVDTDSVGVYEVTYTSVDSSGNESIPLTRIVHVQDNIPPVIELEGDNPIYIFAGTEFVDPGASASDNVDGKLNVITSGQVNTSVAGSNILIYNAYDSAGNIADAVTRIVIVQDSGKDNIPPVISLTGDNPLYLVAGNEFVDPGSTALDDVDGSLTPQIKGVVNGNQPGWYTLTYTVKDSAGNGAKPVIRLVRVIDSDPPIITLNGFEFTEIEVGSQFSDEGANVYDTVDDEVEVYSSGFVNEFVTGTYSIIYTAQDSSGNKATPVTRVIRVSDTKAPVITLNGPPKIQVVAGTNYLDAGATVEDNYDLDVSIVVRGKINTAQSGFQVITYTATDRAGNKAKPMTRVVSVLSDMAPVITLLGDKQITLSVGQIYNEKGATAQDNEDGPVTTQTVGDVNTNIPGVYGLAYLAVDSQGNSAIPVTRTIVVKDQTSPVISLNGEPYIVLEVGQKFQDPGASTQDNVDNNITISVSGFVDTSKADTYILTYTSKDQAGNSADPKTRVVKVETPRDIIAPLLTLIGEDRMDISTGDKFDDPGATAVDDIDGEVTVQREGTVDVNTPGFYSLTYFANDSSGNAADPRIRIVNVLEPKDSTAPVISLFGKAYDQISQGAEFDDPGAEAFDIEDGQVDIFVSGKVDTSVIKTYVLTYTAVDRSGNQAQPKTRIVTVQKLQDTNPPIITLIGDEYLTLPPGEIFQDPGAEAVDSLDGPVDFNTNGLVDISTQGLYTITYTAVDSDGNAASPVVRFVEVVDASDITPPVITIIGATFEEITVGDSFTDSGATAVDELDGELSITTLGAVDTGRVGFYALTYKAADSSGNHAIPVARVVYVAPDPSGAGNLKSQSQRQHKQNFSRVRRVLARTSDVPVITLTGNSDINHSFATVYTDPGATATDSGSDPDTTVSVVVYGLEDVDTNTLGTYTLIYTATDSDGNMANPVVRTVTVVDTVKPTIALNGSAFILHPLGDAYSDPGVSVTDDHDGSLSATVFGQSDLDVNSLGIHTLTYTAQDSSGNKAAPRTRTISVVDVEGPVIVLDGDAAVTHEQGYVYSDPGFSVSDNYDTDIVVNVGGAVDGLVAGTYTLTYEAIDASGNQAVVTRTVVVQDTRPPEIVLAGSSLISHSVNTAYIDPGFAALDAVEGETDVSTSGEVFTNELGTYTLTYAASDSAGNNAFSARMVQVVDSVAPVIIMNGAAIATHQLGTSYADQGAILTDNYDANVSLAAIGNVDVNIAGFYTLNYTGEDSSKNQAIPVTRVIEVVDLIAPVITLNGAAFITQQIDSNYTDAGSIVTDNMDDDLSATVTGSVNMNAVGTYTLVFSVVDSAGNEATRVTRTVTVVDSAPPFITLLGFSDMTVAQGSIFTDPGAIAVDADDPNVEVAVIGSVDTSTAGLYTLIYVAADDDGNQAAPVTRTVTVGVLDNDPPTITLIGDANVTLDLGADYTDLGATASDAVDGDAEVTTIGSVDTSSAGSYTLVYTAKDASGNQSRPVSRLVTVVKTDRTAPVITLTGDEDVLHGLGEDYEDLGADALDAEDGEINVTILGLDDLHVDVPDTYTLTYAAQDSAGNRAEPVVRTVTVEDQTAPHLILLGATRIEIGLGTYYLDDGAEATDNFDDTVSVSSTGSVDTNTPGNYTLIYTAADAAGNQATPLTRTVTVLGSDLQGPVIALNGLLSIVMEIGTAYSDQGATALDDEDGAVGVRVSGFVDVETLGSYTLTYTAVDSSGNQAIPVVRTIFIVDTVNPTLELLGAALVNHEAGQVYNDAGAKAIDAVEGEVIPVLGGAVNVFNPGIYTLTYTAEDSSGNQAIPLNRTVTVVDTTAPVLTLMGEGEMLIKKGAVFDDPGVRIDDAEVGLQFVVAGVLDTEIVGTYTLVYTATDSSGNSAQPVTRSVEVHDLMDVNGPVITLNGNSIITIEAGSVFKDPGATANDAIEGAVAVSIGGEVDSSQPGTYTLSYYAKDTSGNRATTVSRDVKVIDTTAPVISLIGSETLIHSYGKLYVDAGATATDLVDGAVTVVVAGTVDGSAEGEYTLTYSAVDQAGNEAIKLTRTVKVDSFGSNLGLLTFAENEDNTAVILVSCQVGADGGIDIPAVWSGLPVIAIGDSAFEACVGLETVFLPDTIVSIGSAAFSGCRQLIEIVLPDSLESLGDGVFAGCEALESIRFEGNAPTLTEGEQIAGLESNALIYINNHITGFGDLFGGLSVIRPDITPPILTLEGDANLIHEAATLYTDPGASAIDETDGAVAVVTQGKVLANVPGTYFLTYSTVDSSGNEAGQVIRTIQVVDRTPPVITLSGSTRFQQIVTKPFEDPGGSAFDALDGIVPVTVSGAVDVNKMGDYLIAYSSVDASGNASQVVRSVTVGDGLTLHGLVSSQSIINENGGSTLLTIHLSQSAMERVLLFIEATPANRVALSTSIVSVPKGANKVSLIVNAIDDTFANGDQLVSIGIRSIYRSLGQFEVMVRDNEASHLGVVSDGLVSGARVFFDMDGDGLLDEGEPHTLTDKRGTYQLLLPAGLYDRNGDGVVNSRDGQLVAKGGIDTATGLLLRNSLTAPPTATVINPLTTVVNALLSSDPNLNENQATAKVSEAFGLAPDIELLSFDIIHEASQNNDLASNVLRAAAAVQDTMVQIDNLIGSEDLQNISSVALAIAERIKTGASVDMENVDFIQSIAQASAEIAKAEIDSVIAGSVARIIASSNQVKSQAIETSESVADAAIEVSRIQAVAQSTLSDAISTLVSGEDSFENFEASFEPNALNQLVSESVVGPLSGIDTRAGIFDFSSDSYAFDESGRGHRVIAIVRSNGNHGRVKLRVSPAFGTATGNQDFSNTFINVQFEDQEIRKTIDASQLILDDGIQEATENLSLRLSFAEDTPSVAQLGVRQTTDVQIIDNDSAGRIQFSNANDRFVEGLHEQGVIIVERVGGSKGEVLATVSAIGQNGGATPSEDYRLNTTQLRFGDGDLKRRVVFDVIDDTFIESDETITLSLAISDANQSDAVLGDRNFASILLESDDINVAPVISHIEDQEVPEDVALNGLEFTISDDYKNASLLSVTVTSDNPYLIPNTAISIMRGNDPSSFSLSIIPVKQGFGNAIITVSVSDGQLATQTQFNLRVLAVDNSPTISAIPESISAVGKAVVIPFDVNDPDDGASSLLIYVQTQATHYLSKGDLMITGSGNKRQLVLNRNLNAQGRGVFNLIVTDLDGLRSSRQFEVDFGGVTARPVIKLNKLDSSNIELSWEGSFRLFFTRTIGKPFREVLGAQSPYRASLQSQGFYKIMP